MYTAKFEIFLFDQIILIRFLGRFLIHQINWMKSNQSNFKIQSPRVKKIRK